MVSIKVNVRLNIVIILGGKYWFVREESSIGVVKPNKEAF